MGIILPPPNASYEDLRDAAYPVLANLAVVGRLGGTSGIVDRELDGGWVVDAHVGDVVVESAGGTTRPRAMRNLLRGLLDRVYRKTV